MKSIKIVKCIRCIKEADSFKLESFSQPTVFVSGCALTQGFPHLHLSLCSNCGFWPVCSNSGVFSMF